QSKGNNKQITIADVLQQYSPKTEWLRFDQPGVVIRHVSIGIGNRLAMQPIPGEVYGSAQYIGANPGRVTIALDTTNPSFVEQFHRMKMMNQRLTVTPIRAWRRTEVHIASPVINMAGIYTCQIDDITTESVTPNTTRITLRLLEHRIDLTKREQVTRASLFSKTVIKRVLRYLVNIARDYLERRVIKLKTTQPEALDRLQVQRQRLGLKELTATQIQQRFEERIPDYKRQAFQILYGDRGLQIAELDIAATEFGSYADAIRARPELNFVRYTHGAVITQDLIRHAYLLETGNRAVQEGGIFTSIVDFFFGTPDTARPRNEDSAAVDARTRLKNEVLKLHYGTDINISPQSTLLSPDRAAAVEADERRRQFAGRDKLPSTAKAQAEGIYQRYTDYRIVQPTELEIDLLAEFMFRGAANATDEVAVDDSGVT
ncbi:MAG: hypothetical protein GTN93_15305, partial [Anaerolineae bacterium]|nr:hypothetical protein [Anaerolineae bacterium]